MTAGLYFTNEHISRNAIVEKIKKIYEQSALRDLLLPIYERNMSPKGVMMLLDFFTEMLPVTPTWEYIENLKKKVRLVNVPTDSIEATCIKGITDWPNKDSLDYITNALKGDSVLLHDAASAALPGIFTYWKDKTTYHYGMGALPELFATALKHSPENLEMTIQMLSQRTEAAHVDILFRFIRDKPGWKCSNPCFRWPCFSNRCL